MALLTAVATGYQRAGWVARDITESITRPADTTAYASNDALSDSTSAPTVAKVNAAAQSNGRAGVLKSLVITKSTATTTSCAFQLILLQNTYTALEDNAAVDLSDAEANTIVGMVDVAAADWVALANNAVWNNTNLDLPFVCEAASDDLYFLVRWSAAYTPASAEVFQFRFGIVCPQ